MSSNDQIILMQLLDQKKKEIAPEMKDSTFFEVFVAEQILKDYELTYDDIQSGIVGSGGDGGIDGLYIFLNGELIGEDSEISNIKKDVNITLVLIQSKLESGFKEEAIHKFIASTELLNLNLDLHDYKTIYNADLIRIFGRFRQLYMALASRFPTIAFRYYYATKGGGVHPNVQRKTEALQETVQKLFSPSQFSFEFLGAHELLQLARKSPTSSYHLKLAENPISTGQVGFVCLVKLKDLYNLISDQSGKLQRGIFESNVRDYQGKTTINEEIQKTLGGPSTEDFWWLNNGITIIATNATLAGKTLTIEDMQIVNGLQTSNEIFNYFARTPTAAQAEERHVLVRVIVPNDGASRDRIIKATNSQTPIPVASLRATDKVQRDIEEFFEANGLYYDRRKNFHKMMGKPVSKIITIPFLAQAVMAIVLQQPNDSRGRPSSLLKQDSDYGRVFNLDYPISLYLSCATFMKVVDTYLNTLAPDDLLKEKSNIRFHVAMFAASLLAGRPVLKPQDFNGMQLKEADTDLLQKCVAEVWSVFRQQVEQRAEEPDKVAKSREFVEALKQKLSAYFAAQQPQAYGTQVEV